MMILWVLILVGHLGPVAYGFTDRSACEVCRDRWAQRVGPHGPITQVGPCLRTTGTEYAAMERVGGDRIMLRRLREATD